MRTCLIATSLAFQLFFLSCFQSWAQSIPLSELKGYSLEASVDIVDYATKYKNNYLVGKPFYGTIREMNTIYVSANGKLFHRNRWSSGDGTKSSGFENMAKTNTEGLSYNAKVGFVLVGVPSEQKQKTTYVQRFTFSIKRLPDGFACSTSMDRIRRTGEKQYKKYMDANTYTIIDSFTLSNNSCAIRRGNALLN